MKRLHWLGALTASALLFSAAASADDHRDRRNWDRNDHHSDRWDRGDHWRGRDRRWDRGDHWRRDDHWRGRDGRWDERRYHHSRGNRHRVAPGHRYGHGDRRGYWDNRYYGGSRYYGGRHYYGGRGYHYYPPHYRRSSLDATVVLSFPL